MAFAFLKYAQMVSIYLETNVETVEVAVLSARVTRAVENAAIIMFLDLESANAVLRANIFQIASVTCARKTVISANETTNAKFVTLVT